MLGGYQILDLRNIGLTLSASAKTITDADILDQLRNLREYIEKGHDYSKPLNNSPKCVLIRYRDAKNGEKCEVCGYASITSSNNSLTYEIKAKDIIIEVVFEEKTNDDGVKYYDIKTAKYIYSHDENVDGDLEVEGDASVGGDLTVTGNVSGAKFIGDVAFESIKDANGHNRFIEGEMSSDEIEGLTITFSKWSLSGSHLLLVVAGTYTANLTLNADFLLGATINLPSWIFNKIYPQVGSIVDFKDFQTPNSDYSTDSINVYLGKETDLKIRVGGGGHVFEKSGSFRVSFDLLIDNDQE